MLRSYVKSVVICIAVPNLVSTRDCQQRQQEQGPDNNELTPMKPIMPSPNPGTDITTVKPRKRCCPYDFDSKICRYVDDRLLCGYNMNIGRPESKTNEVSLGKDCRIKGGRVECGYNLPPYANERRPPAWANTGDDPVYNEEENSLQVDDHDTNSSGSSSEFQKLKFESKKPVTIKSRTTKRSNGRRVTRCVEIRERIVCRDM